MQCTFETSAVAHGQMIIKAYSIDSYKSRQCCWYMRYMYVYMLVQWSEGDKDDPFFCRSRARLCMPLHLGLEHMITLLRTGGDPVSCRREISRFFTRLASCPDYPELSTC